MKRNTRQPQRFNPLPLIRVSNTIREWLRSFKAKTDNESLQLLKERLQYLEDQASETKLPENIPECRRRLEFLDKYYCVQTDRKGLQKAKELISLDICQICKLEKYNLPSKPQEPRKQEIEMQTAIRDKSNEGFAKAGMRYCPKDTLWVFPSKCEKCKTPCENLHKL